MTKMFANVVVGMWIGVYALAIAICAVYCRFQKKKNAKKNLQKRGQKSKFVNTLDSDGDRNYLDKGPKQIIRKAKKTVDSYLYGLTRYMSIVVGKIPSNRIRKAIMKYVFCMDISSEAVLYGGFEIRSPWNVKIGRAVIGVGALIDGRLSVTIENDVVLASGVSIYTAQHDVNDPMFRVNDKGGAVIIHDHAWISSHSIVLPKVEIGEGAVLSAGAIATKSLEKYGIYSGIPATKKRERTHELKYISGQSYWHFY